MNIELERETDLRQQHKEFSSEGYDGHNRHSGITSMHDLNTRRSRRRWHEITKKMVQDINKIAS